MKKTIAIVLAAGLAIAPQALAGDLTAARDFDLGMTGPPLSIAMDFIAGGLVELVGGLAAAGGVDAETRAIGAIRIFRSSWV